jgi:sec-independent protein translocase protein TatB
MGTPPIQLANVGWADSLILMVMALVVVGPRRLPELGRQIGKLMYEFRKASNDFKFQMEEELRLAEDADRRKKEEERQQALALAAPSRPSAAPESETTAETPTEETYPRIQPPSTGEPVSRALAAQGEAPDEASAELPADPTPDSHLEPEPGPLLAAEAAHSDGTSSAPDPDPTSDSAQAAHHG